VQADDELDNLTRDEYRMLIHAAQCLSKLAVARYCSYTDFPDEIPYDDSSGDDRNSD